MYKIEYEIKLNEQGRPYIDLPEDYEDKPENKFFTLEIVRYFLQSVYIRKSNEFDKHTAEMIDISIRLLGQISDEMAEIIWNMLRTVGDASMMLDRKYHFTIETVEELDKIGDYILSNDKIFKKENGLKVLIIENATVYVYNNNNWINTYES